MRAAALVKNVLYNYAGMIVGTLTGFILTPLLIEHLGHSGYGSWVLLSTLVGYSSLLDFGIGLTVMRMISARTHLEDRSEVLSIAANGLVLYALLGVFAFAAGLAVSPFIGQLFHLSGHRLEQFHVAFILSVLSLSLTFPSAVYTALNQGFHNFRFQNLLVMVGALTGVAVTLGVLHLGGGIVVLAACGLFFNVCIFIVKIVYAARVYGVRPARRHLDRSVIGSILRVSGWLIVGNLASTAIFDTDTVVTGSVLGSAAVAIYAVSLGAANAMQSIGDQFNSVTLAAASSFGATGDTVGLQRLLLEAVRMVAIVLFPLVVIAAVWGRQLFALWVGPSFQSSDHVLVILAFAMAVACMQGGAMQVIIAMGKQKRMFFVTVPEAAVNLGLSFLLARHLGVEGVALGTLIPTAVTTFGIALPYACRLVGLSSTAAARRLILPAAVSGAAYLTLKYLLDGVRFPNLVVLFVVSALSAGVCMAVSVLGDRRERRTYINILLRRSPAAVNSGGTS